MSSELKVDTISEKTSANGVTIDGVLIKDGLVDGKDVSALSAGLTEADHWDITSNVTGTGIITAWARPTGTLQGKLGTGMSHSSGIFTFPSTGYWYVNCNLSINNITASGNDVYMTIPFYTTDDDFSSEDELWNISLSTAANQAHRASASVILDITNVSNQKVKLEVATEVGTVTISGSTSASRSNLQFFKLGDT